jgi:hypothetical protein
MTWTRQLLRFLNCSALLLVAAACGGGQSALYTDPSFDGKSLDADGLLVGGVVTSPTLSEDAQGGDPVTLADALRRRLEERRASELVAPGRLLLEGDVEAYREMLTEYARTARLSANALAGLAPRRSLGRYLLLGRIDLDEIEETHEETRDDQEDRVRFEIELLSRRHMGLSVDVYDLQEERIVWSAAFDRRLQVRGSRFTHEARPDDVENAPIDELREIRERIREEGYPTPPSRDEVLRRLFDDIEEALPQTK